MILLQALILFSILLFTGIVVIMILGTVIITVQSISKKKKLNPPINWLDLLVSLGKGLAYSFLISVLYVITMYIMAFLLH